jgi:hypothetical protein
VYFRDLFIFFKLFVDLVGCQVHGCIQVDRFFLGAKGGLSGVDDDLGHLAVFFDRKNDLRPDQLVKVAFAAVHFLPDVISQSLR